MYLCGISMHSQLDLFTGGGARSEGRAIVRELVRDMLHDESAYHVEEFAGLVGGGGWVVRLK